jgi:hypothetical protein
MCGCEKRIMNEHKRKSGNDTQVAVNDRWGERFKTLSEKVEIENIKL